MGSSSRRRFGLLAGLLALACAALLILAPTPAYGREAYAAGDDDDDGFDPIDDSIQPQVELDAVPVQKPNPAAQAAAAAAAAAKKQLPLAPRSPASYVWEILGLALAVVYLINWQLGRMVNTRLAESWAAALQPELGRQFARLGHFALPNGQLLVPASAHVTEDRGLPGNMLMKLQGHRWQLYATGRRHCRGLLASLELQPRQDLFGGLILGWLRGPQAARDEMTLEIPLAAGMDPQVLLVGPRRSLRRLRRALPDAEQLTSAVGGLAQLPSHLACVAESRAGAQQLLAVVEPELRELGDALLELYVSDRAEGPGLPLARSETGADLQLNQVAAGVPLFVDTLPGQLVPAAQRVLKARFRLPAPSQGMAGIQAQIVPWVAAVLRLVDALATELRLPREVRAQADKHRELYDAELLKAEQAARAAELEYQAGAGGAKKPGVATEEMTPAQLRKLQEKNERKELKKQRKAQLKIIR